MTPSRVIHKTGLATSDIEEQAHYYRRQAGLALALRFVDNAERTFEQLLAMPKLGPLLGLDELLFEDIRRWHIDGFDRLIVLYRERGDGIEVIRVLHSSRNIIGLLQEIP